MTINMESYFKKALVAPHTFVRPKSVTQILNSKKNFKKLSKGL